MSFEAGNNKFQQSGRLASFNAVLLLTVIVCLVAIPVSALAARRDKSSAPKAASCGKALTHKVVSGDNLWDLARRYGVSADQIQRLNRKAVKKLTPGSVLVIRPAVKCQKKVASKAPAKAPAKSPAKSPVKSPAKSPVKASKKASTNASEAGAAADDTTKTGAEKAGVKVPVETGGAESDDPSDEVEDDSGEQYEEAVDDREPSIEVEGHDEAKVGDLAAVVAEPEGDPDLDEVGVDGTDVGEDDENGGTEDDKDTVADDEPEDLVPLPDTLGFGFADDGAACADYLNPITMMPTERKGAVNFYHKVRRGDNMWKIAKKYHVSVKTLQKLNKWNVKGKGGKKKTLRVGHRILVRIGDPKDLMQYRPFLKDWGELHVQEGYSIKRSTTVYGRPWAFKLMLRSFCELRRRVPDIGNVVVGDWSGTLGGPLGRHKSHQTGRDVDLSYFVNNLKCGNYFVRATPWNIDVEKSWELIRALLDTKRVQYIFMDWNLQKVLYEYALSKGFPEADLNLIFQYPEPRKSRTGIIRWARGHDDHIHVRFSCPPATEDPLCR